MLLNPDIIIKIYHNQINIIIGNHCIRIGLRIEILNFYSPVLNHSILKFIIETAEN